MNLTWIGLINQPIIKATQECRVDVMSNGEVIITVYGDTTAAQTYSLGGIYENKPK
jgi:hypothetical protein